MRKERQPAGSSRRKSFLADTGLKTPRSVQVVRRLMNKLRKSLALRHAPGRARTCNPMIRSHTLSSVNRWIIARVCDGRQPSPESPNAFVFSQLDKPKWRGLQRAFKGVPGQPRKLFCAISRNLPIPTTLEMRRCGNTKRKRSVRQR
jgi:hypothetical protein